VLRCPRGHAFDVARSGYVNLLQPGDRRSLAAGDSREAVAARERLEAAGFGDELVEALERTVRGLGQRQGAPALEVGAGTGHALERLAHACGLEAWAVELSAAAAERGARRRPGLAWIVANADRRLPLADGAFELVLSCRGPKSPAELARVLAPGGTLVLVVPAPDDLIELRAAVQGEGRRIDRATPALEAFGRRFRCVGRAEARAVRAMTREQIEDVLTATYRGVRAGVRERLEGIEGLAVTWSSEILRLA